MTNETCRPEAPTGLASCLTVAKGRPLSASISLRMCSTWRAFPRS
jgi:hypothetical protein